MIYRISLVDSFELEGGVAILSRCFLISVICADYVRLSGVTTYLPLHGNHVDRRHFSLDICTNRNSEVKY